MSIYRDKATGQWRFDFDKRIGGERVRRRLLLPPGWTRAQADVYDRKEGAALYALATGIAKPRHLIDQAVACYARERVPHLKAGANAGREIEALRDWWSGRPIEDLPEVCAEYAADQHGARAGLLWRRSRADRAGRIKCAAVAGIFPTRQRRQQRICSPHLGRGHVAALIARPRRNLADADLRNIVHRVHGPVAQVRGPQQRPGHAAELRHTGAAVPAQPSAVEIVAHGAGAGCAARTSSAWRATHSAAAASRSAISSSSAPSVTSPSGIAGPRQHGAVSAAGSGSRCTGSAAGRAQAVKSGSRNNHVSQETGLRADERGRERGRNGTASAGNPGRQRLALGLEALCGSLGLSALSGNSVSKLALLL